MKREKKLIVILCTYIFCLILLAFIRNYFNVDSSSYVVLNFILITLAVILGLAILSFLAMLYILLNKDKKLFAKAINTKDYDTAIEIFKKKTETYFLGRLIINSKYLLLCLYFMSGQNDCGKVLFSTDWRSYSKNVLYFKVLSCLLKGSIEQGEVYFKQLLKCNKKVYAAQIESCQRILNCIKQNDFTDKFYLNSVYPLVKVIYMRYNKLYKE